MMDKAELRAALKKAEAKPMSCVVGLDGQGQAVILLDRHKGPRKLLAEAKARGRAEGLDLDPASLRRGRVSVSDGEAAYALNKAVPPPVRLAMKAPMRAANFPKFTINADPSIEEEPDEEVEEAKGAALDGEGGQGSGSGQVASGQALAADDAPPGRVPAPGPAPDLAAPAAAGGAAPRAPLSAVPPDVAQGIRAALAADPSRRPEMVRLLAQVRAGADAGGPGATERGVAALRQALDGSAPAPAKEDGTAEDQAAGPARPVSATPAPAPGLVPLSPDAAMGKLSDYARAWKALEGQGGAAGPGDTAKQGGPKAPALPASNSAGSADLTSPGNDAARLPPGSDGDLVTPVRQPGTAAAPPRSGVPSPVGANSAPADAARLLPALLDDIKGVRPGQDLGPLRQRVTCMFQGDQMRMAQLHGAISDLADPDPGAQSERARAGVLSGLDEDLAPHAGQRVARAAASGAARGFGDGPLGLEARTQDALRQHGVFPPAGGGGTLAQKAAETAINGPAAVVDLAARAAFGAVGAYQGAVMQVGEETGQQQLARDVAALPEALLPETRVGGAMHAPRGERAAPAMPRGEPVARPGAGGLTAGGAPAAPRGPEPPATVGREAPGGDPMQPNGRTPWLGEAEQPTPRAAPAGAGPGGEAGRDARPGGPDRDGTGATGRPASSTGQDAGLGTMPPIGVPVGGTATATGGGRKVAVAAGPDGGPQAAADTMAGNQSATATGSGTGGGAGGGLPGGTASAASTSGIGTAPAATAGEPAPAGGPHPHNPAAAAPRLPTDPDVAAEQRALAKRLGALPMGSPEALQAADELARASTFTAPPPGRVVLGKWATDGTGYQDVARRDGGTWYQSADGVYGDVKAAAGDDRAAGSVLWQTNEAFLRQQMAARVPRIEFAGMDVQVELALDADKAAERTAVGLDHHSPARIREVRYLQEHGPAQGYRQDGNAFILDQ